MVNSEPEGRRQHARNDGLDLLRATGAALVVATHLYHGFGGEFLGPLAAGGHLGIYLFFPLSGYLLYRPFVAGRVDLRRYAISRLVRLVPAYYVCVAVIAALGLVPAVVASPWATLLFANGIILEPPATGFGHSWTLTTEAVFYVALPVLALGAARRGWLLVPFVILSYWFGMDHTGQFWSYQLSNLFWAFGLGMLVARYQDRAAWLARLWPLGAALIVLGLLKASVAERGNDFVAVGGTILIVASAVVRPSIPWARFPADISYGVYLYHLSAMILAARLLSPGPGLALLAVFVTVVIAALSFLLVERPLLRFAARGARVRGSAAATPTAAPSATP